jgi:aspartate aminotransferase-like enzyme
MSPMFIPGPVDVDPTVLAAQTQPMLPHRSQEFERVFQRARLKAQPLFGTEAQVFIVTSSGSGLQEAAVRNLAAGNVLCLVNGAFSERWFEVAQSNGKPADSLEMDWGKAVDPQLVADALQRKQYELITVVHNETSTGVENPVPEIAAAVHDISPTTLIGVDAVSSLGGVPIEMDKWGLDLVLTSSQKCLALPPGLALAAVSERAMDRARSVPNRGWYFDLVRLAEHLVKDSTPATPALSLIYALDLQLDHILQEGLEQRFARHGQMASAVRDWVTANGFRLFAEPGHRSQTVTTVSNMLGVDLKQLNQFLAARQMRIANGYGTLRDKTFRIAHMGETQLVDIQALLEALSEYLEKMPTVNKE